MQKTQIIQEVDSVAGAKVRKSIVMASKDFALKDGSEAADLVIENERLKTTIEILNSKLKMQQDTEDAVTLARKRTRVLEDDAFTMRDEMSKLRSRVSELENDSADLAILKKQYHDLEEENAKLR